MLNTKKTPDFFVAMTSLDMSSHASPPPSLAAVLSVRCPRFLWAFCMLSASLYNCFSRAFDIALPHDFHLLPYLLSCAIQDAFYSLSNVLCICFPHAFCTFHTIPPPIISPLGSTQFRLPHLPYAACIIIDTSSRAICVAFFTAPALALWIVNLLLTRLSHFVQAAV